MVEWNSKPGVAGNWGERTALGVLFDFLVDRMNRDTCQGNKVPDIQFT